MLSTHTSPVRTPVLRGLHAPSALRAHACGASTSNAVSTTTPIWSVFLTASVGSGPQKPRSAWISRKETAAVLSTKPAKSVKQMWLVVGAMMAVARALGDAWKEASVGLSTQSLEYSTGTQITVLHLTGSLLNVPYVTAMATVRVTIRVNASSHVVITLKALTVSTAHTSSMAPPSMEAFAGPACVMNMVRHATGKLVAATATQKE